MAFPRRTCGAYESGLRVQHGAKAACRRERWHRLRRTGSSLSSSFSSGFPSNWPARMPTSTVPEMIPVGVGCIEATTTVTQGELRNARGPEFDLGGPEPPWRIPGERMEMRRKSPGEHLVPLSTQAAALLTELRTITGRDPHDLLFAGLVPGKPISDATLGQALRRLGYGSERIVPHGLRRSQESRECIDPAQDAVRSSATASERAS